VTRDVGEQRRLQAQLMVSDRMVSVGMLAAGVAHEINNPLAAVTANVELAVDALAHRGSTDPDLVEIQDELADALDGAERVRLIVQDLKILARTDSSDGLGPVDVEATMESSIRLAWNQIRHRARMVREYGKVPKVVANESRLGQVFLNLLVNAAQALPDGHADTNEIRVTTRLDPGGRVLVEVSDTGPGIPPEIRRHLFTPFFTTKPVGVGTGLGLAICQRLVTGFHGEIRFDSVVGKGTTFTISLEVALECEEAAPEASAQPAPAPRRGRVLVVDDEASIGAVVRRILSGEHEVVTVTRGQEALRLLHDGERFDVILCDLMMPEMGGQEVFERLEHDSPEMAGRVVFLTGGAFTPAAQEFLSHSDRPRVEKPFDPRKLRESVNVRVT
jgi:nitrogen-specific signal transduction histidine kinase/CheY-like chemotaxis protein